MRFRYTNSKDKGADDMKILTFDVGGTFIKYALMNEDSDILEKGKVKTPQDAQESFFQALDGVVFSYEDLDGLAFSLPGIMDAPKGYIYVGGALLYNNECNMVELLKKRYGLPVTIENDARCAALAEVWKGNLSDCEDGIVMILGTGVGGAIIKHREVHRGKGFFAGEFSYIMDSTVMEKGFEASFATRASAIAFVERVKARKGIQTDFSGEDVFHLIEEKDEIAISCLREYCDCIAIELFNLQAIYDPDRICIGGGISQQPKLVETIKECLANIYAKIPWTIPSGEIVPCRFANDSNLIGACYNFLHRK